MFKREYCHIRETGFQSHYSKHILRALSYIATMKKVDASERCIFFWKGGIFALHQLSQICCWMRDEVPLLFFVGVEGGIKTARTPHQRKAASAFTSMSLQHVSQDDPGKSLPKKTQASQRHQRRLEGNGTMTARETMWPEWIQA